MKVLDKKLKGLVKDYERDANYLSVEDFLTEGPTALDIELTHTLLLRKELSSVAQEIPKELKDRVKRSDRKMIEVWERIKNAKVKNLHAKVAISTLEEIIKEIKQHPF